jgi:hypothetical protein
MSLVYAHHYTSLGALRHFMDKPGHVEVETDTLAAITKALDEAGL